MPCNLDLECGEFVHHYDRVVEKFEGQLEVPAPIERLYSLYDSSDGPAECIVLISLDVVVIAILQSRPGR